jgi:hypothetical protein
MDSERLRKIAASCSRKMRPRAARISREQAQELRAKNYADYSSEIEACSNPLVNISVEDLEVL